MNPEQKLPSFIWFKRGALAFIGFILSPLSWWNDIFINIPLAYGFAWVIGKVIDIFFDVHRFLFTGLFIIGYFLTNLLGFLMIHYSITADNGKKESPLKQILISLFYTIVIVLLTYFDVLNLNLNLNILPHWVIK
ncbi:MAG: hypothetical protein NTX82_03315 [Candidatus Parcubacteria bacterium]|nr:hypothetical protein [Candidatus Parcubacteria bacterium]